jgi:hypothetical protein
MLQDAAHNQNNTIAIRALIYVKNDKPEGIGPAQAPRQTLLSVRRKQSQKKRAAIQQPSVSEGNAPPETTVQRNQDTERARVLCPWSQTPATKRICSSSRFGIQEVTMSLLHQTDVYQGSNEKADRKYSGYGFVLALVCVALALVVASVMFTPAPVGSGIGDEVLFVRSLTRR